MQAVDRDWVHVNGGIYLSGGIVYDLRWQVGWQDFAVLPLQQYAAPVGKVVYHFVQALSAELTSVWKYH